MNQDLRQTNDPPPPVPVSRDDRALGPDLTRSAGSGAARSSSRLRRPAWLGEFERQQGRPLRVLHIGNIANNAYNNAKIQRKIGVEADVICQNYYHMMGTPEWEDANFLGKHGDDFFPDWWRVDLNGFTRPRWFFQGPRELCFEAVRAKFVEPRRFELAFTQLEFATNLVCYRRSRLRDKGSPAFDRAVHRRRRAAFAAHLLRFASDEPLRFLQVITNIVVAVGGVWLRRALSRVAPVRWFYRRVVTPFFRGAGNLFARTTGKRFSEVFGVKLRGYILDATGRSLVYRRNAAPPSQEAPVAVTPAVEVVNAAATNQRAIEEQASDAARPADGRPPAPEGPTFWIDDHFRWHRDADPAVLEKDIVLAHSLGSAWKSVLDNYDVIQCYSVDGIIPMSHGRTDYLAYEHGTLRSIPFEPTPIGRLTATAYRQAFRSLVTNLDNLDSCRKLEIARDRVVPLPHALDDEKIHGFALKHTNVRPSGHDAPEFLSPSRQHWLDKDPNFAKGNDIFFDALARLKARGYRARVTLVAWGRDLEASKTYIRDLGIEDFVTWVPPMTGEELWKRYLGCHAVVDQFIIPAFGRVTFDSLLLGKPVITNLDVALATEFFGVAPPILVSATVDDAERALKRILDDPEDSQGLGAASAAWAATYHSTQRILDLQLDAYRETIAARTVGAADPADTRTAGR